MRSFFVYVGLLSAVVMSQVGCSTMANLARSRQVNLVATIKSNQAQHTQRSSQEGKVTATVSKSHSLAEFVPKWDSYRTHLAMLLETGKCEGETVCEYEEMYRSDDKGMYAVRLDGVIESGDIPVNTIESELEISIVVRSSANNTLAGEIHKVLSPKMFKMEDCQQLWLSTSEDLKPLVIEMEAGVQYLVKTRLALSARSKSGFDNTPISIEGEFRLFLEPLEQIKIRKEHAKSLAHKLIELWAREDPKYTEDPQLKKAADTFSRLFLREAVRYVDIHAPPHNRLACFEHARIVREWYEVRMRLNPNLARWFRMTTVRRNTPFLWQSSNMITPNVSVLPDRWLDDGAGLIVEVRDSGINNFYGRSLNAEEFCMMGLHPKIQQTARIPALNAE